jgi:hypothetical protein
MYLGAFKNTLDISYMCSYMIIKYMYSIYDKLVLDALI